LLYIFVYIFALIILHKTQREFVYYISLLGYIY